MTEKEKIPVLLAADRPENLNALETLVEGMGLDCVNAVSGNEAVRLALRRDFALVLLDVRLSDVDGFGSAELMLANPKTRRLPVLLVTSAALDEIHKLKGYESGVIDYLLKPVDPVMVRNKVRIFSELFRDLREIGLREQRLEILIAERTAELRNTNERLERELAERGRAELAVQASEERFRKLLASVTSYLYTVAIEHGRPSVTTHGPGCAVVTGFTPEDYARDTQLWFRMIHEEDRQAVLETASKILTARSALTHEHRIRHKDGSIRWVSSTLVPHIGPEGSLRSYDGLITDITEKKQAEEKLLEYHKLVEGLQDMIAIVDRNYMYLLANTSFLRYRNQEREQVVGRRVPEVLGKELFENVVKKHLDSCFQGKAVTFEMKYAYPRLGERNLLVSYYPIEETGRIKRVASVISDITERTRAEAALRESEGKLLKLNEELEQRVRERTGELEKKNEELEKMIKAFVGRELRMVELKNHIAELEGRTVEKEGEQ